MRLEQDKKYDDIINLPHHISTRHPRMSLADRAAQFSPFAALTGHEAVISETARLTEAFAELDEDRKEQLDEQLQMLKENQFQRPEITVTYFRPDEKKRGGAYMTICGNMKKIDEYTHRIFMVDGEEIPIENILSIEGNLFF